MILQKIKLQRFKKLIQFEADFVPGLNVLQGPNEAGKTTLLLAIYAALFNNPASQAREVRNYQSWNEEEMGNITLQFRANNLEYLLYKDFSEGRSTLVDKTRGRKWENFREIQDKIGELLGFTTEEIFKNTAFVDQLAVAEISRNDKGKRKISDSLTTIMTGGKDEVNATEVINKLRKVLSEMEKGRNHLAKEPGILRTLEDECQEARKQIEISSRATKEVENWQEELNQIEGEIQALEKDLEINKKLIENNLQRQEIEQRIQDLKEEYRLYEERVKNFRENQRRLEELEEQLPNLGEIIKLNQDQIESFYQLSAQMDYRQKEVENREKTLEQLTEKIPTKLSLILLRKPMVLISLLLFLVSIVGGTLFSPWFWTSAGLGFLLIIIFLAGMGSDIRDKKEQLRRIKFELTELQNFLYQLENSAREKLAIYGVSSPRELIARWNEYLQLREQKNALENQIKEGKNLADLEEEGRDIRLRLRKEEDHLQEPEMKSSQLDPYEFQRLKNRIVSQEKRLKDLQHRKIALETLLNQSRVSLEEVAFWEEKKAELEERLQAIKKRHAMLTLIKNTLEEAKNHTLIPAKKILEGKSGEYLCLLTRGRYSQVEVEEGTLDFKIYLPQYRRWQNPEGLSKGTIDQFYFAVRLALVEIISQERKPPLLLDDPFVTFDEERLQGAIRILQDFSRSHQIFLFTCRKDYDSFADKVIYLPAPGIPQQSI